MLTAPPTDPQTFWPANRRSASCYKLARTFIEIVGTGSFIKAADRLHVAQTTVSARVRLLEQQLGRPLFIRNKGGASLPQRASNSCASRRPSYNYGSAQNSKWQSPKVIVPF
ncbi:helix-turn-helix domain-containing protein [Nitrobacter vulgaris]|uniref:helix-turn-helix domain-containing protein n=1 Tax=Nitrobacter vulgaris TaxID=29421 RepID=UPI001FCD8581|nr:LysR family transcriptional regulator [Nitrobacter vulgaris]